MSILFGKKLNQYLFDARSVHLNDTDVLRASHHTGADICISAQQYHYLPEQINCSNQDFHVYKNSNNSFIVYKIQFDKNKWSCPWNSDHHCTQKVVRSRTLSFRYCCYFLYNNYLNQLSLTSGYFFFEKTDGSILIISTKIPLILIHGIVSLATGLIETGNMLFSMKCWTRFDALFHSLLLL